MSLQIKAALMFSVSALLSFPAFAVFKCNDTSGRPIFQERPCQGEGTRVEVKPASGSATSTSTPVTSPPNVGGHGKEPVISEAQRLNNLALKLNRENRLSTINNFELKAAYGRINAAVSQCDQRMAALQHKKSFSKNNLAGATWEQSISSEMQSVAALCASEQQRHQMGLDRLLAEKAQIERELGM